MYLFAVFPFQAKYTCRWPLTHYTILVIIYSYLKNKANHHAACTCRLMFTSRKIPSSSIVIHQVKHPSTENQFQNIMLLNFMLATVNLHVSVGYSWSETAMGILCEQTITTTLVKISSSS